MKILIVAATQAEIGPIVESIKSKVKSSESDHGPWTMDHGLVEFLITGVGMVATAFALGRHLAADSYDLAINLGIAGSFDRSLSLGDVVEVTSDTFSELGAEDGDNFLTLDAMGFGQTGFKATAELERFYKGRSLRKVSGITVNTVHGNEANIAKLQQRTNPQLESMEGAAFFYACAQAGVPALQIRAISNYVEKRNREAWKIGLAVKNLNEFAAAFIGGL